MDREDVCLWVLSCKKQGGVGDVIAKMLLFLLVIFF